MWKKKRLIKILYVLVVSVAALTALFFALAYGWLGIHDGPGVITEARIPQEIISEREITQLDSSKKLDKKGAKQILFGDLHVHTTYSFDAFIGSLPMMHGEGSRPLGDACDFARFCSALDFWSINDHAEASTPRRWSETIESIQQCNAVGGDGNNPDTVATVSGLFPSPPTALHC